MNPRIIRLALIVMLFASVGAMTGCRREPERAIPTTTTAPVTSPPTMTRRTITIGTFSKAYGNLPYYVARHFRWFESDPALANATIRYAEYNDRPAISDALSKGELQILFSGDAPALLCRAQGNRIRAIAMSGNAQQEILVRPGGRITRVSEMKGRTTAVLQATSSHYALLKILRANGMSEQDVRLTFLSPAEARVAFESGRVDAWAVWAPFVEQQEVAGTGKALAGGDALINSVVSVSETYLSEDEL